MSKSDVECLNSGSKPRAGKRCGSSRVAPFATDSRELMDTLSKAVQQIVTLTNKIKELELTVSSHSSKLVELNDDSQEDAENGRSFYLQSDSSEGNISGMKNLYFNGRKRKRHSKRKGKHSMKFSSKHDQDQNFSTSSDSEDSGNNFCDRSRCCGHNRKVKSGAQIKKRPVVKTELWPHTIANEEDGEEVDSESISLEKFFACFTHIMLNCSHAESKGRTALLHAVSLVLECLPWADARIFHNLIMVKIEQDRINWSANFPALANDYLDKKVRLSLRATRSTVTDSQHKVIASPSKEFGVPRNNLISKAIPYIVWCAGNGILALVHMGKIARGGMCAGLVPMQAS